MASYLTRDMLWDDEVMELERLANLQGVQIPMERIDLRAMERSQYVLGAGDRPQQEDAVGDERVEEMIRQEVRTINAMLKAHNIRAEASVGRVLVARSSFVSYGLALAPGERIARIEAIDRELANALRQVRARMGVNRPMMVRVRDQPVAIETPHPAPVPLDWRSAPVEVAPMQALIGKRYYGGATEELIALPSQHHMLVAAQSGGGKSTLMRLALCSLCLATSPADLAVMLIDLKNEDLVPFQDLPHAVSYAGSVAAAADRIGWLHRERDRRVAGTQRTPRILLVIDELAELGDDREALAQLGRILSTGRSLGINVWAGTQYPTASAIGGVVSRSWTLRLVGRVDGAQAANVATQRPATGAQYLAHPGDFLRVEGPDLVRFKAWWMPAEASGEMVRRIQARWRGLRPALAEEPSGAAAGSAQGVSMETAADDEQGRLVRIVGPLEERGASMAEMIRACFGATANTGGANRQRVLRALEVVRAAATTTALQEVDEVVEEVD